MENMNSLLAKYIFEDKVADTDYLLTIASEFIEIYHRRVARQESERRQRLWRYLHYRRESVLSMGILLQAARGLDYGNKERSCWALPRNRDWWENMVLKEWNDEFWLTNFRMTRATFMAVAEQLRPFIEKEVTSMRTPITVEHRLAITLWRLATNIEYMSLSKLFGVGRSTVCCIVHETCRAIEKHLMPKIIRFPENRELLNTVDEFNTKCGFPQVAGLVDCTHISIKTPKDSLEDYLNQNEFHSVVLQAVVDHRGMFIDTDVGQPGSLLEANVFSLSSLHRSLSRGTLFNPNPTQLIEGETVPLLLFGTSAYPLLPNLMKCYSDDEQMTEDQKHFNLQLSSTHANIQSVFGRLKGRWQILNKTNHNQLNSINSLVHACCTLHNICESNGDPFQPAWLSGIDNSTSRNEHCECPLPEASKTRHALTEFLKNQ
ncbi:uncharacterized protein [Antedon mediterranea]|uniref:uncharacterized protein n=1 Tax=Antedon mediterranea TaxID=105859 RepID=UPI003AF72E47